MTRKVKNPMTDDLTRWYPMTDTRYQDAVTRPVTTRLLFKVLAADGSACHGGTGRWPLPTQHADGTWTPGEPLTVTGQLVPCENGLHLSRLADLIHWVGPTIYTVQVPVGVDEIVGDDKIVVRMARLERRLDTWNERTARHFACDCAERVLHLTTDPRPADAVRIARLFADGLASRDDLSAARRAAGGASWNVAGPARSAAESAAWAAWAAGSTPGAAGAARSATWAAGSAAGPAWSAAESEARSAEREWQTARLLQYLRGET